MPKLEAKLDEIIRLLNELVTLTGKKKKTKKKATAEPSLSLSGAINHFRDRHLEAVGYPYMVVHGKDNALIKRMVSTYGEDETKRLIDLFFWDRGADLVNKAGYTIGVFHARVPSLVKDALPNYDAIKTARTHKSVTPNQSNQRRW